MWYAFPSAYSRMGPAMQVITYMKITGVPRRYQTHTTARDGRKTIAAYSRQRNFFVWRPYHIARNNPENKMAIRPTKVIAGSTDSL